MRRLRALYMLERAARIPQTGVSVTMTPTFNSANQKSLRRASVAAMVVALTIPLSSTNVAAISRYWSPSMSCNSIKAAIRNEGAVILQHRSKRTGNLLYNRYVRNENHCRADQTTRAKSIPAADTSNCLVQYCVRKERRCDDFFRRC